MANSEEMSKEHGSDDTNVNRHGKDRRYGWVVLSVTTVGALLATIQESALLISLPDIMGALHMEFLTMLWVLLVYLIIITVMVPIFGRLSDMFGRKRLYVVGSGLFTLGSLLCALAQPQYHGWDLVGYRVIQALGGALLLANGAAMIADAFEKERLGFGLGVNQIAGASGLVLGPVIGGMLSPLGWQWVFLVNVPFGLFGTVWAIARLKEPKSVPKSQTFDWAGSATFFIGIFALLLALSLLSFPLVGQDVVDVLFVVAVVGIVAFFAIEWKAKHPMIDFKMFRNREYAVGNFTNFLNGLCLGAATFLLVFFFQGPYGFDPLTAGLSLIPLGVTMMVVGPISGRMSDKYGPRNLTILGLALAAVALLGLATINHSTPYWLIAALMIGLGAGNGLYSSPNTSSIMNSCPPERRGTASSTRTMLRNTGSMISLSLAFPMVLSGLSTQDTLNLFLYGGGISAHALVVFENGLHEAFLLFFVVAVITMFVAMLRPRSQIARRN